MPVEDPSGATSLSITIHAVSAAVIVADSCNSIGPTMSMSASSGALPQYRTQTSFRLGHIMFRSLKDNPVAHSVLRYQVKSADLRVPDPSLCRDAPWRAVHKGPPNNGRLERVSSIG